jgi:transcriptional regulator with GAF, ATPase, and Fis domain
VNEQPEDLNLKSLEVRAIVSALERSHWIQVDACELLGISPRVLNYKLKAHAICYPEGVSKAAHAARGRRTPANDRE